MQRTGTINDNRTVPKPEKTEALSFYVDHSRDPITNVLAFIYCRPSSSASLDDSLGAIGGASRSAAYWFSPGNTRGESQNEDDEFRVLGSGSRPSSFPWLLYCMLEDSAAHGTDEVISWADHGRSFRIHDRKTFETHIMPR